MDRKLHRLGIPRNNKKLLVIDLDHTLCDIDPNPGGHIVLRPHTEFFLTEAYKEYDIIIWSATSLITVKSKLQVLSLLINKNFKILCYVGISAMIEVKTDLHKKVFTKDLTAIWNEFPRYNASNTILVDDKKKNFLKHDECGLLISPFAVENTDASDDSELLAVLKYLLAIASQHENFLSINHHNWRTHAK